ARGRHDGDRLVGGPPALRYGSAGARVDEDPVDSQESPWYSHESPRRRPAIELTPAVRIARRSGKDHRWHDSAPTNGPRSSSARRSTRRRRRGRKSGARRRPRASTTTSTGARPSGSIRRRGPSPAKTATSRRRKKTSTRTSRRTRPADHRHRAVKSSVPIATAV